MSSVVDVGDVIELTFATVTGAAVTVSWLNPDQVAVLDAEPVTEDPAGSGKFPWTLRPTTAGMWTAEFRASGVTEAIERYYVRVTSFTGPPPLAAVGDVAAQFGTLTAAQQTLAAWLLRAASRMIRAARPSIDAQIADGTVDGDLAALAVTNMVLRVLRNPGGLRAETTGPFSRSYDTSVAAGLLVFTPGEASLLIPVADAVSADSGPVRMIRPAAPLAPARVRRSDVGNVSCPSTISGTVYGWW